jgi:hypothetical protein
MRKNNTSSVGRLYHVDPSEGERFYLRLLLDSIPGASSYEHLKTQDWDTPHAVTHPTFKAACVARGLLLDNVLWDNFLEERALISISSQLRTAFVSMIVYNQVADPRQLFEKYLQHFAEDFLYQARHTNPDRELDDDIRDRVLRDIQRELQGLSKDLSHFDLPEPAEQLPEVVVADEVGRYDVAGQRQHVEEWLPRLNTEQLAAYAGIMQSVNATTLGDLPNLFFVDGIGGAGKTCLYSVLLSTVRGGGGIAIAVASSGIAALLLESGSTSHSRFKIPIKDLHKDSACFISVQSSLADLLRAADIIVWDEACMMHKHAFMAVDRSLRDVTGSTCPDLRRKPFGGKVVVFGGDFRQILPVVKHGTRSDVVAASLNRAPSIWSRVKQYKLHINMRVQRLLSAGGPDAAAQAQKQQEYADFLKRVGDGTEPGREADGKIEIPMACCCQGYTEEDLIQEVYGDLDGMTPEERHGRITRCAILAPTNKEVDALNDMATEKYKLPDEQGVPSPEDTFYSADSVRDCSNPALYPTEFLNSLEFGGVPPHALHLRLGSPVILMRNMAGGLANGTRMIVKSMTRNCIEALVTTGPKEGNTVLIPRLLLTPSDMDKYPFTLCRCQFPIRAAYAMTINKSQGQTLESAGVYLKKSVFTHGQLYTSLSRTGSPDGMIVLAERDENGKMYTDNVVYREVLI